MALFRVKCGNHKDCENLFLCLPAVIHLCDMYSKNFVLVTCIKFSECIRVSCNFNLYLGASRNIW